MFYSLLQLSLPYWIHLNLWNITFQVIDSPPCIFPHRRSLCCSTPLGWSSGDVKAAPLPSPLPAGLQTRDAGGSRCQSTEWRYRGGVLLQRNPVTHKTSVFQLNLPRCGRDRRGRRHETPGLQQRWFGRYTHTVWPPDQTGRGDHADLVVYSKRSSIIQPKPDTFSFPEWRSDTCCTFKVKTDHRAEEAGSNGEPEVTLEASGLKHSLKKKQPFIHAVLIR